MGSRYLLFILLISSSIFPLAGSHGLSRNLERASHAQEPPSGDYVPGELIIGLQPGFQAADLNLAQDEVLPADGRELEGLSAIVIQVPVGQEEAIRADLLEDAGIAFVEPNYYVHADLAPNDPLYSDPGQYGPGRIQAESAWDMTTGSSGVILAIIDSGIDASHPELTGRVLPGYDYVDDDNDPFDLYGHGTHVAGIAAAAGNNSTGIAGMDWNVRILPLRVLDTFGNGNVADLSSALVSAADQGADVINMSLGGYFESTLLEQATYYAFLKGAALFASAGNNGIGVITKPAAYPWVTAVGATNQTDTRASLSNTGVDLDVMAPGNTILSTLPGNLYGTKSGTSMSSAFASGTASLLASQASFSSPEKIYYALRHTALDLAAPGLDSTTGFGLVQARSALSENFSQLVVPPPVEYDILSSADCSAETFEWIDATGGIYQAAPSQNDDASQVVTIPFTFKYGGVSQSSVRISSNGYLTFSTDGAESMNHPLTASGNPDLIIAPYWDDLNPTLSPLSQAAVYTLTKGLPGDRLFIIEYLLFPLQSNPDAVLTFEVIFYEATGDIRFQYLAMEGLGADGSSATIGLEYYDGNTSAQYAYNRPGALKANQSIHFVRRSPGTNQSISGCLLAETIGDTGGTIQNGAFSVVLPPGLIPNRFTSTLSINLASSFLPQLSGYNDLHHYADIRLLPSPPKPYPPALTILYHYSAEDVLAGGGHPENLLLASYDGTSNTWELLPSVLDTSSRTLSAQVTHLSVFGVYSLSRPESLPVTGASKSAGTWLVFLLFLLAGAWMWPKK